MPEKVLVYSRFPKAMMLRIGERFELMDAGGKPPAEVFTAEQLSDVRAMIDADIKTTSEVVKAANLTFPE